MPNCYPNIETRPIRDLREMIDDTTRLFSTRPAFHEKKDGVYTPIPYARLREEIDALGTLLTEEGYLGTRVMVIGENCYEWALSYLTVLCGGGVILPIDKELPSEEISRICEFAHVSLVLHADSVTKKLQDLPDGVGAIPFSTFPTLIAQGKELLLRGKDGYLRAEIDPEAMSVLLFTSGTTGVSKGVMLSQKNLCFDIEQCAKMIRVYESDILLSALPLHHTYECTVGFLLPLYHGASIAYAEKLSTIAKNLKEVRATAMICVPLLLETFYKKIWQTAEKSGKAEKMRKAIAAGRGIKKLGINLSKSLFTELHKNFGGRLRLLVSGGAAIKPEVLSGLNDLGLTAIQGYGLTECAPLVSVNPIKAPKHASVGLVLPDGAFRILDPDENGVGEILYRGDNVMLGYYESPELTDEVIKDGWFHTGDLGYLDADGYLYITGRAKNVIVTYNGKNIFPEEIELHLDRDSLIAESMVVGEEKEDGETVIKAYLYLNEAEVAAILKENGLSADTPEGARLIEEALAERIRRINLSLPSYKRIRRFVIRKTEFVKTSTRKIRRFDEENRTGEDLNA